MEPVVVYVYMLELYRELWSVLCEYSKISLIRYRVYNDTLYITIYTP